MRIIHKIQHGGEREMEEREREGEGRGGMFICWVRDMNFQSPQQTKNKKGQEHHRDVSNDTTTSRQH